MCFTQLGQAAQESNNGGAAAAPVAADVSTAAAPAAQAQPAPRDAFDAILSTDPQEQKAPAGRVGSVPAFRPGRFLAASQLSGDAVGVPSGAAATSVTAEPSVTADLDGPNAVNSPQSGGDGCAATQLMASGGGGGMTTPSKVARVRPAAGDEAGCFITAPGRPAAAQAGIAAPAGPPLLQADAVTPCKARTGTPSAVSPPPLIPPQPLRPVSAAAQPGYFSVVHSSTDRAPLAAMQTPAQARVANCKPQQQAGSTGKKRKSTTLVSDQRPRASRTRRQSATTLDAAPPADAAVSGQ